MTRHLVVRQGRDATEPVLLYWVDAEDEHDAVDKVVSAESAHGLGTVFLVAQADALSHFTVGLIKADELRSL